MSDLISALENMFEYFERPNEKTSPAMLETYLRHLERFPEPAVVAAIDQAIGTCTFRPKIAEITNIISEHANGPDDLAETAWNEVQAEVRRVGYQPNKTFRNGVWYEPAKPDFSNERIAEAVQSIGWKTICTGDIEDVRRDFIFTYRNLRKRDVNKIQRGDFTGLTGPALTDGANAKSLKEGDAA